MNDDQEVDWGNDEDDPNMSRAYSTLIDINYATGGDDAEDAVSLGGDEEEEFAAYGARPNERSTHTDKISSKKDVRRRSASVGVSPRKETSQVPPVLLPPSPQPEVNQPTPKLTHALPPKPVVSSSIRAPPSTTAASPMSMPRKERRSNGSATKKGDEPVLADRETRSSHTAGRDGRYRDSRADESPWTRPGSGATDSQPLHQDRTRSFDDRDGRPSSRREDDCYRPSHRQSHYSSDEEGREPNSQHAQSRNDIRYRYNERDRRHDYTSGDRTDRPSARTARLSPEDESVDRSRTGYRESNDSDSRRVHPRDRDPSPVRDDSSRRVLRRDDYHDYDSFDKGSRDYDDPSRRSAGSGERSRYPESFNGRTNSVVSREHHTQNQGPGRSSTLRRDPPSPRPRSQSPPYHRRDDRGHTSAHYQEYPSDSSRLPHYRGRAESPPSRLRGSDRLDRRDTPLDLPQRRPRVVSDAHDPDYAVKRRKVDDRDGTLPLVRRGPVGADTYTPQETSTASTSPRSTGALDDLSRQRRREPLPPQSHRYKEASDLAIRPPLSGSNRVMPQTQPNTSPLHRHYPAISRDHEVFSSRHPDTDTERLGRPRASGHDLGHAYMDKFSRHDHMDVDPPYPSRAPYEESAHPREVPNRTSSHDEAIGRGTIPPIPRSRRRGSQNAVPATPIASAPVAVGGVRGRSRDGSPQPRREPRQAKLPSVAPLPTLQPGPPQNLPSAEDHRYRGRRFDHGQDYEREGLSPTLPRNPPNAVAPRPQSTGRYDEPEGGHRSLRSPELRAALSTQEQSRYQTSSASGPRRERQATAISHSNEVHPPRARSNSTSKYNPPQERPSRSGPPPDTIFPPSSPPPAPTSASTAREWVPRPPEFMSNLPPPSTRLPGAPPPPILPQPYSAPRDPDVYPRLPSSKDDDTSVMPEGDHGRQPPQDDYKQQPPSPTGQSKDGPPPRPLQIQEGRREQAPLHSSERVSRGPVGGHKENSREERHIRAPPEERRSSKVPLDDRQVTPASWDRPRDPVPTPKPLALPASLPPKPVAALGDLDMQQSTSSRAGHQPRGRRSQQHPADEGNSHSTRWGPAPRGDGGREKDRERNRWAPAPEYQGPSLLARMSSYDSFVGETMEIQERGGEVQRKRARSKKYQGV